jgi:hypothetical protein
MTLTNTIRLGPKGHLVIPEDLREGFREGEELVGISYEDRLTLTKAS